MVFGIWSVVLLTIKFDFVCPTVDSLLRSILCGQGRIILVNFLVKYVAAAARIIIPVA